MADHIFNNLFVVQLITRASLEGITQVSIITIFNTFIDLLILNIFPYLCFVQANGTNIIATCPKTVSTKILLQPTILLKYYYRTLSF